MLASVTRAARSPGTQGAALEFGSLYSSASVGMGMQLESGVPAAIESIV